MKQMNQKAIITLLFLTIALEVYFILRNPLLFQQHYPVLFIIPIVAAAYLFVLYSQRKISRIAKANPLITPEQHQQYIQTEGVRLTNELIATQKFEKIMDLKLGKIQEEPLSELQQQQQDEIVKELQDMENSIFDD